MRGAPLALMVISWHGYAADCRQCHPREAAAHAASAHAHSLQPVLDSRFFQALPDRPIGEARGGFLLTYQRQGRALLVTAARGGESASALIEWVFGAGRRGETPVARRGSTWFEHRVSYYAAGGRIDLTMGHRAGVSGSAEKALGVAQAPEVIARCFGCHGSGGLPGAASFEPGVQCGRCHAGAGRHALGEGMPRNPGRMSARQQVAFCAGCHRDQPEGNPDDPINVRFQPVRLERSKCFRSGSLSCLNCHDPHADARPDAAWYRERCLACHADQKDSGDCLPCHMPRVTLRGGFAFTDHYIRVRKRSPLAAMVLE